MTCILIHSVAQTQVEFSTATSVYRCGNTDLKRAGEVRFCIPEVDQTQHHYTNEQPPQEAHEVQQAVDVSHKQLEHGHRVLYIQTHTHRHLGS